MDRKVPGHSQEIFLQQQREQAVQAGIMPELATCSDLGNTGLGPRERGRAGRQDWLQTSYWFLSPCISEFSLDSDAVILHWPGKMTQPLHWKCAHRIFIRLKAEQPSSFREFTGLL